ncbi:MULTISPECIES: EAL domain-containing protein [unclassified Luteimonas]|uniref:sensor domain-containing protein n=1 Tax=unclassified Luteimonas TaxID=2629088 RepID=UPI001602F1C3|nr:MULTISPECIES: EAL domain-containing protein [unclassified Luteimonas]MBB1471627.1 EAL domain-containing protein [Luteimonas sp. MC1782]MBB6599634.1 EAL domain-containing protein [Luteimonas sp. MC1825]QOC87324.1 EAL domain-containing protein [Luteimonas sp. MC1825]
MSASGLQETPVPPSANDGSAQVLAALDCASRDSTLPARTRDLLCRARDALQAASVDAEIARLRYHALFDAVPDPVSIIDEHGTVLDLNKAGMAAYRRPREEVVGQPIHVLNPDLPEDHMGPVWEAVDRGESFVIEVSNMRADGTRFPVEVHSAGFLHEGRRCVVAVARDLSRRQEAEVRYRELMEVIDKGIVIQTADGSLVYANSAALRMIGVPGHVPGYPKQRTPRPAGEWMVLREDGSEMPADEYPAMRAIREGRLVGSTLLGLYHRPQRKLRWLSVTAVPQYAAGSDRPHQALSMFSDVTALKRDSALFHRVQALARIGGWEWDRASARLYLTDVAAGILAQAQVPASIDDMIACLAHDDRPRFRRAVEATILEGHGFDLELQGARADGHAFWVRVIGEAEPGDPGASRITGTLQDITAHKQGQETLRVQARTDPLTGLLNRDAILGELAARMADATQSRVAVLYIDLDRFKMVNDVLGHAAGDDLLVTAAQRLRRAVGTEGLIARFGGDEFLVACSTADDPDCPERLADAILDVFAVGFGVDKEEFAVTASIGIARAPDDGETPHALIQSADTAMYESKRRVRNGRQVFTPAMAQSQRDRLRFETQLRHAADNDEFHLVYQPQVDLASGRIVAAEALIRWRNERLGEMRPDHFIAHAESTGDIVRIGHWVLSMACRQVAEWRDAGHGIVRVAVNVSYRQFLGDDLAAKVRALLDEYALPGSALELEFTERVLIEDAPETLNTFAQLRAMGVALAIDDFGEGYSALNYLRRLPIQGLKLSQLFVTGVPGNASDVAVCQAVAGIAHSLGLGLVAEGVENEEQRAFLLALGVPVGQGFLFAPGLPADQFALRLGAPVSG